MQLQTIARHTSPEDEVAGLLIFSSAGAGITAPSSGITPIYLRSPRTVRSPWHPETASDWAAALDGTECGALLGRDISVVSKTQASHREGASRIRRMRTTKRPNRPWMESFLNFSLVSLALLLSVEPHDNLLHYTAVELPVARTRRYLVDEMVSLFGLKIGAEKKRKPEQELSTTTFQQRQIEQWASRHTGQRKNGEVSPGLPYVTGPRPSTAKASHGPPVSHSIQAFYNPGTQNLASSSMLDLSRQESNGDAALPTLRPALSNPNLGTRWNNGSSQTLGTAASGGSGSTVSQPNTARIKPLDVQSTNVSSTPTTTSPLSQEHPRFPADDEKTLAPNMDTSHPLPRPLQIHKAQPPAIPPRSARRNVPTPPPSVKASSEIDRLSILERPILPAAALDARPSSRGSNRTIPTSIKELMDTDDYMSPGSVSVPTPPPSLPRASNETINRGSMNEWGEPVIQTVRAKRETMTISPARRRSSEKMVESLDRSTRLAEEQRPKTAGNPRADRPSPLNMDLRPDTPDLGGPSSAPFPARQRSESPYGGRSRSAARTGVPAAAVGARGRPKRPNANGVRRPAANEYDIHRAETPVQMFGDIRRVQTPVQVEDVRPKPTPVQVGDVRRVPTPVQMFDDIRRRPTPVQIDDVRHIPTPVQVEDIRRPPTPVQVFDDIHRVQTPVQMLDDESIRSSGSESLDPPDSPLLPRTGPLASPVPPFEEPPVQVPRGELNLGFSFPDRSRTTGDLPRFVDNTKSDEGFKPPIESPSWPLPSTALMTGVELTTLSTTRSQSPFAIPSFSRPWTPTNARPGTPVKMAEQLVVPGIRGPSPSPRGAPPRTTPKYAVGNPNAIPERSGASFI
ncbi:uncharacterized protein JN550_003182 [Neoarthrinium moseri]|uniref:uncharacterized protein n=1 Tax=Neoarthrinium moseri TaxID=1658444 RepID=UPI001FDC2720|nr:uncharacterized protein JN550_003182 [Neoarthrinium moseri]KAI1873913.1 hypothetical protein JN550_003182 [Neoarthrinium moseri]